MSSRVTVNSDLGESIGLHSFGNDDVLLSLVDTVNVACGMHAGDPGAMERTVVAAIAAGVSLGAHPGLPDIQGFGRREMAMTPDEVRDLVRYQVGALVGFLDAHGATLDHIKPHGALFAMTARDEALMRAVCEVALQYDVPVYGLAGTAHETTSRKLGVGFVPELYVDLDYRADGTLIVERTPPSRSLDEVRQRVARVLSEEVVIAVDGTRIPAPARSICVHSDLTDAAAIASTVREAIGPRVRATS